MRRGRGAGPASPAGGKGGHLLRLLLLALLAACSPDRAVERDAARLEEEFLGWWEEAAEADTASAAPERSRQETFALTRLHPLDAASTPRPRQARGTAWEALDLGSIAHRRAVLWLPRAPACATASAYLGVEPLERWTELRIDPHCDPAYGAEDVELTLHKLHEITWPLVEIVASGPACVPSELYRYDEGAGRYLRLREAC